MWKNMMVLNGTIEAKEGTELDKEKFFRLLSENSYEFEGGFEIVDRDELNAAVKRINEFITKEKLDVMVAEVHKQYEHMSETDIKYFFDSNSGTGSFDAVFLAVLDEEMKKLYRKYTHTNWHISDTFGGNLGQAIANRLN